MPCLQLLEQFLVYFVDKLPALVKNDNFCATIPARLMLLSNLTNSQLPPYQLNIWYKKRATDSALLFRNGAASGHLEK